MSAQQVRATVTKANLDKAAEGYKFWYVVRKDGVIKKTMRVLSGLTGKWEVKNGPEEKSVIALYVEPDYVSAYKLDSVIALMGTYDVLLEVLQNSSLVTTADNKKRVLSEDEASELLAMYSITYDNYLEKRQMVEEIIARQRSAEVVVKAKKAQKAIPRYNLEDFTAFSKFSIEVRKADQEGKKKGAGSVARKSPGPSKRLIDRLGQLMDGEMINVTNMTVDGSNARKGKVPTEGGKSTLAKLPNFDIYSSSRPGFEHAVQTLIQEGAISAADRDAYLQAAFQELATRPVRTPRGTAKAVAKPLPRQVKTKDTVTRGLKALREANEKRVRETQDKKDRSPSPGVVRGQTRAARPTLVPVGRTQSIASPSFAPPRIPPTIGGRAGGNSPTRQF